MNLIGSEEAWCHRAALFKRKARTGSSDPWAVLSVWLVWIQSCPLLQHHEWGEWGFHSGRDTWGWDGAKLHSENVKGFRVVRACRPWSYLPGSLTLFLSGFAWQVQKLVKLQLLQIQNERASLFASDWTVSWKVLWDLDLRREGWVSVFSLLQRFVLLRRVGLHMSSLVGTFQNVSRLAIWWKSASEEKQGKDYIAWSCGNLACTNYICS